MLEFFIMFCLNYQKNRGDWYWRSNKMRWIVLTRNKVNKQISINSEMKQKLIGEKMLGKETSKLSFAFFSCVFAKTNIDCSDFKHLIYLVQHLKPTVRSTVWSLFGELIKVLQNLRERTKSNEDLNWKPIQMVIVSLSRWPWAIIWKSFWTRTEWSKNFQRQSGISHSESGWWASGVLLTITS